MIMLRVIGRRGAIADIDADNEHVCFWTKLTSLIRALVSANDP